ncbi:MAG: VanZ family protein [Oscillospiraceae bacterium]|nr:VanZ family protein [Oscillospiraceae bacterium]
MDLRRGFIKILWIIFIIYLAVLLRITVFRSGFSIMNAFSGGEINIIPIADLIKVFLSDKRYFIYLFFGNIVWFVPFGFLLKRLTRLPVIKIIFFGFLLSLFIETMQFIFGVGVSETDDLILNTIGVIVGAVMPVRRIFSVTD